MVGARTAISGGGVAPPPPSTGDRLALERTAREPRADIAVVRLRRDGGELFAVGDRAERAGAGRSRRDCRPGEQEEGPQSAHALPSRAGVVAFGTKGRVGAVHGLGSGSNSMRVGSRTSTFPSGTRVLMSPWLSWPKYFEAYWAITGRALSN